MKNKKSPLANITNRLRVNLQVKTLRAAVIQNAPEGITDLPAHGFVHLPFKNYRLFDGTIEKLNSQLAEQDIKVDTYQIKTKDRLIDRIAVTHLDGSAIEPSPAYQSALQARFSVTT
jgi:hypothetical protein